MNQREEVNNYFPSPSEKEELNREIDTLREKIALNKKDLNLSETMLKLADLLVGRNEPGDYIEAGKLYEEIINTNPPGRIYSEALIGKAELLVQNLGKESIDEALNLCKRSIGILRHLKDSYFEKKSLIVMAELYLRRGEEKDNIEALRIFDDILNDPSSSDYFRMRALAGKIDLMEYFLPQKLNENVSEFIALCNREVRINKDRPNDYFMIKLKILLAELYTLRGEENDLKEARVILDEVINNERACVDLRARASLDLAEISSISVAKTLIRQVKHMEGIDPYILNKAKLLEQKISKKEK